MLSEYPYPNAPKAFSEEWTKPSQEFRRGVISVLFSIIGFVLTYLALVVAGIGFAIVCGFVAFLIVSTVFNLWLVVLAVGITCMGFLVLYFLFKFIFKSKSIDRGQMVAITHNDHPMLFDFIARVARETHTPMPKRVYLSADVNAFVFYDSSFWSMFLPIRKNLNIGLGLVNCVTISEFKAVLAHEFGHFSQRSMKLGSYVYNANHIIHDLLYDNEGYDDTLQRFAQVSGIFAVVAQVTVRIVIVIQQILQRVHSLMYRRFMALSRQMEFHADAMAASVSGSAPLARALYRLDLAQNSYHQMLQDYNEWIKENRRAINMYEHHTLMMHDYARHNNIIVNHGLVNMDRKTLERYRTNRVMVKDQWASHPSTEDREDHLNSIAATAEEVNDSAWTLFRNPEELQKEFTDSIYTTVQFPQSPTLVDCEAFREFTAQRNARYALHPAYKGFYDFAREINTFNPEQAKSETPPSALSEILTDENLNLWNKITGLDQDIATLEAIQQKNAGIKTFDFDGRKFKTKEAPYLMKQLQAERMTLQNSLALADKNLFLLYHGKCDTNGNGKIAINAYKDFFSKYTKTESCLKNLESRINEVMQLYQSRVNQEFAIALTNNMKLEGDKVKNQIDEILSDETYSPFYSLEDKKVLRDFINDKRRYFDLTHGFDSAAIALYGQSMDLFGKIIYEHGFAAKKKLLDDQIAVILNCEHQHVVMTEVRIDVD